MTDRDYSPLKPKGKYKQFPVLNDEMDDDSEFAYYEGDIVLAREILPEYWSNKLRHDDWYFVLEYKYKKYRIARITDHDVEKQILTCEPLNEDYPKFTVFMGDLYGLYNIVRRIHRNIDNS